MAIELVIFFNDGTPEQDIVDIAVHALKKSFVLGVHRLQPDKDNQVPTDTVIHNAPEALQ